jgi:hypothetical protein
MNHTPTDFARNPVLFVELAHAWAAGGPAPAVEYEEMLTELTRPCFKTPSVAREQLWGVLSFPQRGRALVWLDKVGLLRELFPSWSRERERRKKRLNACEQVHVERWAEGLSDKSLRTINTQLDKPIGGGLSGWAVASLAALLLTGDVPSVEHAALVDHDLTKLGASPAEREAVRETILAYPPLYQTLTLDHPVTRTFTALTAVTTLSSLFAYENITDEQRRTAIARCEALFRQGNIK